MDKAENTEVDSRMSLPNQSAKNSLLSIDGAKDIEVCEGDGGNNKTVKRSPFRMLNGPTGYLTSLHFGKR